MYSKSKHFLKNIRWQMRRTQAARRWGADNLIAMPAVLGNAMPKSGSHLIIQVLLGLTELGPFVDPGFPPVNRDEQNRKLAVENILSEVRAMHPGDIRYGYLHAEEPWISAVTGPGRATIFVHRDPRDWVVSQVFYATDMHEGHMMHAYYEKLGSMEARINASIQGVNSTEISAPSVAERYSHYIDWLETPGVLRLRFEDLIENREAAIGNILDYLENFDFRPAIARERAVAALARRIAPHKSGTFRKGKPGEWREHFSEANINLFKEVAGDLLVNLGYEQNLDW